MSVAKLKLAVLKRFLSGAGDRAILFWSPVSQIMPGYLLAFSDYSGRLPLILSMACLGGACGGYQPFCVDRPSALGGFHSLEVTTCQYICSNYHQQ